MAYNASNPNGQAAMANSAPVVIANDQNTIPVKLENDISNTTGTLTTSTSTVVATTLTGVGGVTVMISGTYGAMTVNFEVSVNGGTTWVLVVGQPLASLNPVQVMSPALTANTTYVWNVSPLLGANQFRVRASSYTSGTANVIIAPSAQFAQPLVNVATMPTTTITGTVTANVAYINPSTAGTGLTLTNQSQQALTNTVVYVKAAAARMYEYDFYNPNSTGVWVQIFNLASGVVLGTTVPVRTIYVPPTSGRDWTSPYSMSLSAGLAIACTATNTGNGSPGSAIQAYIGYV